VGKNKLNKNKKTKEMNHSFLNRIRKKKIIADISCCAGAAKIKNGNWSGKNFYCSGCRICHHIKAYIVAQQ